MLLLVFGTLVGAAIPMVMAIISIIVALGITALIGQAFELNLFITNMVVAMGLALGIDYSLFIVSRLREERHKGATPREAILTVANTATRAVVFSGTAFGLAMIGMLLVPDTTLRSLGLGAVIVGLVSIVVALTFHPALLMVLGDRVDRLRLRGSAAHRRVGRRGGTALAARGARASCAVRRSACSPRRRPARAGVTGARFAASATRARRRCRTTRSPSRAWSRWSATSRPGRPIRSRSWSTASPDDARTQQGLTRLRAALAADRDFAARALTVEPGRGSRGLRAADGRAEQRAGLGGDRPPARRLRARRVRFDRGPRLRSAAAGRGARLLRGQRRWLPIVIAFVLTLSFVLLTLAFRSIAIPLTAIVVNLLSVGAAYGILVLVFQKGVGADLLGFAQVERIDAWVPVFLFSVLFGLSMDYQVFLLSRIHERWRPPATHPAHRPRRRLHRAADHRRRGDHRRRVRRLRHGPARRLPADGLRHRGRAAIDATLVRLLVIPATMGLLGDRNWYLPSWLDWLPDMQIEGHQPDAPAPKPEREAVAV